ncbi:protein croquemort-like [Sitophilus oryzae]|uniref:Protein croquemort-like n=1 Tax=Sitophilus oryzae TaxID=7048 RepID=A0A6J2X7R3_SITOR|nr:protein croquemort-like [Sitophilus oryzae]XP_030747228.1 protein croquemort-like [Sitophilus oryzae]XP_030747229.1 protein croquemort-like [Sitophilus oryzae]
MGCCSPSCAKWTTLSVSLVCLIIGLVLAVWWQSLFQKIVYEELSVSNEKTTGYQMWKETPIPMYLEFHLFNWTNSDRVEKYSVKPTFEELGPYTFYEHHIRENITFNDNDTITYMTKRTWQFLEDKSNGSLDDLLTVLNPIVVVVANRIKEEHYLVKRAVNFFFEEKGENIVVKKTVRDLLFEGYNDPLINIALKLNISGLKLPFKKFGWFVDRNNSVTYDGVFNMYSGGDDISKLGLITQWNYEHQTSYYKDTCGVVSGTSGELWYPPLSDDEIAIFASDLCSNVKLHRNGTDYLYGITGNQYVGQADVFDNGTYYKESKCFASGQPTGVRGVSSCKFGAPAYMSFPHFYLSDSVYRNQVEGMNPDPSKHATKISLEPNTGLPLRVYAAFQLNLLMERTEGINILSNIKTTMMPCFWFAQKAELSKDLSSVGKMLLIGKKLGTYTGYGFLVVGVILFGGFVILFKKRWHKEGERLLK